MVTLPSDDEHPTVVDEVATALMVVGPLGTTTLSVEFSAVDPVDTNYNFVIT